MRTNIFISILIYVGEYILNGLEYNTVSAAGVIPHKCRPVILTVNGIFFVKLLPMPRSKRSQEVNLTDQRLRFPSRYDHPWPPRDERDSCTRFNSTVFTTAATAKVVVITNLFIGVILISVIQNRSVIRRKENQGLVLQPSLLMTRHQRANLPVALRHHISARTKGCNTLKTFVYNPGHMNIDRVVVNKEGVVRIVIHKIDRFIHQDIGNILIPPKSRFPTFHITDPRSEEHTSELQSRDQLVCLLRL